MEIQSILQKFHKRLVREAILKATVCGVIIGFGLGALVMAVSWLITAHPGFLPWLPTFNGTRIAPILGVGVSAVAALIFYRVRFRPTMKDAARRVDALGLEERAVTMLDAAGDDRLIPALQRADTAERLARVPHTRLKFAVRKLTAVIACVCILCMAATVIIPNAYGLYTPLTEEEIIDRLIEELRQEIDAAEDVREEVKDELHSIVDELEEASESMDTTQGKVDAIKETADRIHSILEEASDKEDDKESDETSDEMSDESSDDPSEQNPNEVLDEELQDSINNALEQLQPGSPPPEGSPTEGENGEDGEGSNGSNGSRPTEDTPPQQGDNGQGSNDNAEGNGQHNQIDDTYGKSFKDGETPYTDEYDAYFKQEMIRLEKTDLSDAEREMIARYFAAMMVEADKNPA